LLSAILRLTDGIFDLDHRLSKLPENTASLVEAACADVKSLLGADDAEISRARRNVAHLIRSSGPASLAGVVHRSAECKSMFRTARTIATDESAPSFEMVHLLRALIVLGSLELRALLPKRMSEKPPVSFETRVNSFVDQFNLKRVTLILSDIVGSTAIKQRFGDVEAMRIFRTHDNVFRDELRRMNQATVLKTTGDGFLLAFANDADAVAFALQVQARLRREPALVAVPVRARMGIYSGEILTRIIEGSGESDPIFGITIDTTARISGLAGANQILTDSSVRLRAEGPLSARTLGSLGTVKWHDHGAYQLKGLAEPLRIVEVGEDGLASFAQPTGNEKALRLTSDAGPS
jgi:class 3 adenylate cyclase